MTNAFLEHVNITVSNPEHTAELLIKIFGWHIRWQGDATHAGRTIHVGTADNYIALFSKANPQKSVEDSYDTIGALNHLGIAVEDLDNTEERVRQVGYKPHSHADYEPGRRFYFNDGDDIEIEVISY